MNRRGAGVCFCMISAFLFALVVVTRLVIFNTSNWTSDDFTYQDIIFYEHISLCLSITSLIIGSFYIFSAERKEYQNRNK